MSGWSAERFGPRDGLALVVLVHGGFWRAQFSAEELTPLAEAIAEEGLAVWNLEYPRLGMPGGGWPGTALAVAAGLDAALVEAAGRPVAVVGHSAGGQLALWAARGRGLAAAVGLAPALDLLAAAREDRGEGAVREFLGRGPEEAPELYAEASPLARLPLGVPTLIVHGDADPRLPVRGSRAYAEAAREAGDECRLLELEGVGHLEVIDPGGPAWPVLRERLGSLP